MKVDSERVENIVEKGENTAFQHFLLFFFTIFFKMNSTFRSLKLLIVRKRVLSHIKVHENDYFRPLKVWFFFSAQKVFVYSSPLKRFLTLDHTIPTFNALEKIQENCVRKDNHHILLFQQCFLSFPKQ